MELDINIGIANFLISESNFNCCFQELKTTTIHLYAYSAETLEVMVLVDANVTYIATKKSQHVHPSSSKTQWPRLLGHDYCKSPK